MDVRVYLLFGGAVIAFVGVIWIIVKAFKESMKHGLLCTFIPPYGLYYVYTRWTRTKIAFSVCLGALAILLYSLWPSIMKQAAMMEPSRIELAAGYQIQHILRPELTSPSDVDVGPNGDIFVTEWEEHGIGRIVRISSDGTVSTYAEVDLAVQAIACSPSGDGLSVMAIVW